MNEVLFEQSFAEQPRSLGEVIAERDSLLIYVEESSFDHDDMILEVLKMILIFFLGPPSPGGSRGRVRSAIFLRKS